MSHNKIKIGTAVPNVNSEINPSLSDLTDVSLSSLNSNQTLIYNGSTWGNGAPQAQAEYIWIGRGESNDYSNATTNNITTNSIWYLYDSNVVNNITNSTINYVTSTNWVESVTLPAGVYVVEAQFHSEFTATGYLYLRLSNSVNTVLSNVAFVGADLSLDPHTSTISSRFEITSAMVTAGTNAVSLKVANSSNISQPTGTTPVQGNTPAEYSYMMLRKVG
jgi:hypothetical protein